jgi:hypothetical protein
MKTIPPGWISGLCLRYQKALAALLFTLYSYNFPVKTMILTIDGVNNGQPVAIPFDAAKDGWVDVPLQITGTGPLTIKSVIFVQPDGTQYDFTEPFLGFTKGATLDTTKTDKWGSIC